MGRSGVCCCRVVGALLLCLLCSPRPALAIEGVHLSLPVFRFQGETVYRTEYEKSHTQGSGVESRAEQRISNVFRGQGTSGGFLWKPWFSRLDLNASGSFSHNSSRTTTDDARTTSRDFSLNAAGDASLTLYPGSRFPANITLRHGETYNEGDGGHDRQFSNELSLSQDYRPLSPTWPTLRADYDRKIIEDARSVSTDDALRVRAREVLGPHRLSGNFEWLHSLDEGDLSRSENESVALFGDHSVALEDDIYVNSFGSYIDTANRSAGSGEQTAEIWQVVNNIRWAPPRFYGLDLRADTRVSGTLQEGLTSSERFDFNNALGADYRLTDNLDVNGRVETRYDEVDGSKALNFNESGGLSYRSDALLWRGWQYNWNAGASGGYRHGDGGSGENLAARFSHALRQDQLFDLPGRTSMLLRQSASYNFFVGGGQAPASLAHLANFNWRKADESVSDYLSVSLSDDRDVGGATSERQQLNVQLERDQSVRGGDKISTDLVGELRRSLEKEEEAIGASLRGELEYSRNHLWSIPNLNYVLNLNASLDKDLKGGEGAGELQSQMAMSNTLSWGLGRLLVQARGNASVSNAGENLGLFLEVRRFWASF